MRILLPTDGSDEALSALRYALQFTQRFVSPSQFELLVVHDPDSIALMVESLGVAPVGEVIEERGEHELERSVRILRDAGVTFTSTVLKGPVASTILEHIRVTNPDLVIMGVKGRGVIGDLLVGSVARAVTARSTRPVLLVDPQKLGEGVSPAQTQPA